MLKFYCTTVNIGASNKDVESAAHFPEQLRELKKVPCTARSVPWPHLLPVAVIKTMAQSNLRRKFILAYSSQSDVKESQGRNSVQKPGSRTGTEVRGNTAFCGLLKQLLMQPRTKLSRGRPPTVLGPPTSTNNQENTSTDLPTGQLEGGNLLD